jgi:hypothetical protein
MYAGLDFNKEGDLLSAWASDKSPASDAVAKAKLTSQPGEPGSTSVTYSATGPFSHISSFCSEEVAYIP